MKHITKHDFNFLNIILRFSVMNWHIRKKYFARLCLWISGLENVGKPCGISGRCASISLPLVLLLTS